MGGPEGSAGHNEANLARGAPHPDSLSGGTARGPYRGRGMLLGARTGKQSQKKRNEILWNLEVAPQSFAVFSNMRVLPFMRNIATFRSYAQRDIRTTLQPPGRPLETTCQGDCQICSSATFRGYARRGIRTTLQPPARPPAHGELEVSCATRYQNNSSTSGAPPAHGGLEVPCSSMQQSPSL